MPRSAAEQALFEALDGENILTIEQVKEIIYICNRVEEVNMEKYNEFHTDVSPGGTKFQLTFITNDKNNFFAMQDLARKCIDGEDISSLEARVLVLEQDKKIRDIRDRVTSLFASMQYGSLCNNKENCALQK